MKKKAVHINTSTAFADIVSEALTMGTNFSADSDTDIAAKGATIIGKRTAAVNADVMVTNLTTQLATAVIAKSDAEASLIEAINSGVDKANEKYPNNEAKLSGLGCTLSKEKQALPIPGKVMNGSAVQSEHSGKANMHWKSEPNAKIYFVMETTSTDIMNESKYYPANPTSFDNSKGGEVTPKTLGVPVWWRVYAHNASGDGVWSDPFGGRPIS